MRDRRDGVDGLPGDGERASSPIEDRGSDSRMPRRYRSALELLEEDRERAPAGFTMAVMAALPERPDTRWADRLLSLWPARGRWALPALAGAMATLALAVGLNLVQKASTRGLVAVTFEMHAPDARRVELVGSFTDWKPGQILLRGPDATGHWTATLRLPAGRHEYAYLLDGREWVTDPEAPAQRPDGFGRENAVIQL